MGLAGNQASHLEVADVVHRPCVVQNRRDIGSQKSLAVFDTDNHRTVLSGYIDLTGIVLEHNGKGIGASDSDHCPGKGVYGSDAVLLVVVVNQLNCDFRVGSAVKDIPVGQELGLDFLIVFDYSVMHTHYVGFNNPGAGVLAVSADMRMGIDLCRLTVCRPPSVTDSTVSDKVTAVIGLLNQVCQLSDGLDHLSGFRTVSDGNSC